jgi:nicotinate-nucleotide adenylyltransferase
VADQAGKALCLDQVLFLPDAQPPHVDHKEAIDAKDRVAMLRLAIANNSFFGLELDEVKRGGASYSYDTVKRLKERHPDVDYYFIIGGDMVDYLPTWYRIDDLVKLVHFVGVRRPGAKNETSYPVTWVDVPQIDFSSTDIRQRVKTGQSIKYMVPSAVEDYIEEHQLYHD